MIVKIGTEIRIYLFLINLGHRFDYGSKLDRVFSLEANSSPFFIK